VGKLVFIPFSVGTGLLAGFLGSKLFELLWGLFDDEEAPEPEHRDVQWGRLALALVIEGAIFRLIRGLVDRGSRKGYERLTGRWPGEEEPEST
jgi:hypothetical protein